MKQGGLEPGIYFNLPAKIYHADTALSRSDILALNDTPFTYWEKSWMNPNRKPPKESSEEMEFGEAFHCQLFEPKRFERDYFVFPTDKWNDGKIMISKQDHDAIVASIKVLRGNKATNLMLSYGQPEVTIVFDAFGHRFRTRHDWLTPVLTTDFKTSFSLAEWHLKRAFEKYGYDIQLYLYRLARIRFKEQFLAGEAHVFGNVDEKFFEKFLYDQQDGFAFIFMRPTHPYPYEPLFPEDDTEQKGEDRTAKAIQVYDKNFAKYGTSEWEVCDGKPKRFSMIYGIIREN